MSEAYYEIIKQGPFNIPISEEERERSSVLDQKIAGLREEIAHINESKGRLEQERATLKNDKIKRKIRMISTYETMEKNGKIKVFLIGIISAIFIFSGFLAVSIFFLRSNFMKNPQKIILGILGIVASFIVAGGSAFLIIWKGLEIVSRQKHRFSKKEDTLINEEFNDKITEAEKNLKDKEEQLAQKLSECDSLIDERDLILKKQMAEEVQRKTANYEEDEQRINAYKQRLRRRFIPCMKSSEQSGSCVSSQEMNFINENTSWQDCFDFFEEDEEGDNLFNYGPHGNTHLHMAVKCCNVDAVSYIVEEDFENKLLRSLNDQGLTPLHLLAFCKDPEKGSKIAELLIRKKVKISKSKMESSKKQKAINLINGPVTVTVKKEKVSKGNFSEEEEFLVEEVWTEKIQETRDDIEDFVLDGYDGNMPTHITPFWLAKATRNGWFINFLRRKRAEEITPIEYLAPRFYQSTYEIQMVLEATEGEGGIRKTVQLENVLFSRIQREKS